MLLPPGKYVSHIAVHKGAEKGENNPTAHRVSTQEDFYAVQRIPVSKFDDIILGESMWRQHLPNNYEKAFIALSHSVQRGTVTSTPSDDSGGAK